MSGNNDIKITGSGSINSGSYNLIKVTGEAEILGDISCESLKATGECRSLGKLSSNSISITGDFYIKDDVNIKDILKVTGDARFNKDVNCNKLKLTGDVSIDGSLNAGISNMIGDIKISKDCQCNEFKLHGAARINGLLTADKIDIKVTHNSFVKEIGGEEIIVRISILKKILSLGLIRLGNLSSDLIEGDKINITNTICKLVRGHDIIIGPGCNIERVEYTGTLTVDKGSKVGEKECMKN